MTRRRGGTQVHRREDDHSEQRYMRSEGRGAWHVTGVEGGGRTEGGRGRGEEDEDEGRGCRTQGKERAGGGGVSGEIDDRWWMVVVLCDKSFCPMPKHISRSTKRLRSKLALDVVRIVHPLFVRVIFYVCELVSSCQRVPTYLVICSSPRKKGMLKPN